MIQCALQSKNEHIYAYSALGTDALFLYHDICGVALKVAAVSVSNILKPLTIRIATDGFEYPNFNSIIPEFDETLLKEASSDFIYYNQYNKWDMLVNYDKLSY